MEGSCCERPSVWKQIHNKLLKLVFHGYKTHTHVCLPFHSIWTCLCVFMCERESGRHKFSFWNLNIPVSSFAALCAAIPTYLSFPPIPNTGTLPMDVISPAAPMCAQTDPREPLALSGSFSFPPSLLLLPLFLSSLMHLCLLLLVLKKRLRGCKEVRLKVLRPPWRNQPLFSVTAPEVCLWSPKLLLKMRLMAFALSFIRPLLSLCAEADIKGDS